MTPRTLNRSRIVAAAIDLADAEGHAALSMSRLAARMDCGTMSLYRHVAGKDELLALMVSTAVGSPPDVTCRTDWAGALTDWAFGLWQTYHRHPWILSVTATHPPTDPGQLAWLDAGLAALSSSRLSEHDKVAAVMAVLHYVRGAVALAIEAARSDPPPFVTLVTEVLDTSRYPALAAAIQAGAFKAADGDHLADFRSGLRQLIDGIRVRAERP